MKPQHLDIKPEEILEPGEDQGGKTIWLKFATISEFSNLLTWAHLADSPANGGRMPLNTCLGTISKL